VREFSAREPGGVGEHGHASGDGGGVQ
jgi:hypothetical protein